jgi:hypothetical protein
VQYGIVQKLAVPRLEQLAGGRRTRQSLAEGAVRAKPGGFDDSHLP